AFAYEQALVTPGVVVLHEANLHHLIAEMTIKRGDWDAYLREVEYDGGEQALDWGRRVQALEAGPDYDGVPMMRRLLERSRGVIVHSRWVEREVRGAGFAGPLAVIPHGAWIPETDRMGYRQRLGVGPETPLIGILGFLKPYKRIAESLRAFRRLLRVWPEAKMVLVGEPHPEFPLAPLIRSLGLERSVRLLGFTAIEDFTGYLAACDVVLNLRYPTVGESSGTLLRSLGLGRAVIVSDVGSFAEYPDEICLKVPVDATEEDTLYEYLDVLVARPDLARAMGERARAWVAAECNWNLAAERYAAFLGCVVEGKDWVQPQPRAAAACAPARIETAPPPHEPVTDDYIIGWAQDESSRTYVDTHVSRLAKTLEITPAGGPGDRVLEMGAYLQITPALRTKLGYSEVRGCYYGAAGQSELRRVASAAGERFECEIDLFNAEKDCFPYPDGHFTTILCCELLEHLENDPMHMMAEINRTLKAGGWLVLTTPNVASLRAISAIVQGYHPGFFQAYIRPPRPGEEAEARHNREYTPLEIGRLLHDAGFETVCLETGPFRDQPAPEHHWVLHLLDHYRLATELRGDGIYVVGRKTGPVRERWPSWLYSGGG
ncbi:MAG: methyltransferase domain-containing protein, partial [Acidobacteria bacterium]|nr:methyltransferase domain-containing protein [Acidobacteriota bacterium]